MSAAPMQRVNGRPWSNWSTLQRVVPRETVLPTTEEQILELLRDANESGRKVRPIGSGHSFTATAVASDLQLDLTEFQGLVGINREKKQVTLKAGTKLWRIPELLQGLGLAMQNLGDINRQSILGAVSTSTHGTGLKFGGLGSQVAGLKMVTGAGEMLEVTGEDPQQLDALRVSLGAYGVVTEITLQLVDDFDLEVFEETASLEETLTNWRQLCENNDHFEFFWFTGSEQVIAKTSQRLAPHAKERTPANRFKDTLNEEIIGNGAFAAICQVGRFAPQLTTKLNQLATSGWGKVHKVKHWSEGFASPRRVRFNEMEYALPFDAVPEVLREISRVVKQRNLPSTFPLEVRAAAADTGWLASNHGRETGYIAVHQHISQSFTEYFNAVEEIFKAHEGRPHWGKLHTLNAADLATRYPHWEASLKLRDELDPNRVLENAYLRQVFGA